MGQDDMPHALIGAEATDLDADRPDVDAESQAADPAWRPITKRRATRL
jgi:hypothetical protein